MIKRKQIFKNNISLDVLSADYKRTSIVCDYTLELLLNWKVYLSVLLLYSSKHEREMYDSSLVDYQSMYADNIKAKIRLFYVLHSSSIIDDDVYVDKFFNELGGKESQMLYIKGSYFKLTSLSICSKKKLAQDIRKAKLEAIESRR